MDKIKNFFFFYRKYIEIHTIEILPQKMSSYSSFIVCVFMDEKYPTDNSSTTFRDIFYASNHNYRIIPNKDPWSINLIIKQFIRMKENVNGRCWKRVGVFERSFIAALALIKPHLLYPAGAYISIHWHRGN